MTDTDAQLTRAVLSHGPLSRSALTAHLGLSPASLTRLTRPLLEAGVLVELDEVANGAVGRRSRPLDIAPDAGSFIGVKLTGDHLYAVATDVRAEPLTDAAGDLLALDEPLREPDPATVTAQIADVVARLDPPRLRRVGVSLGALVRGGSVAVATFLRWSDVPLADDLVARIGVPVSLENDIVALAEAERWFGLGRSIPGFVLITVGVGIGYAVVVDGRRVDTADAGTGTGAHIPLDPLGPLCSRGHRGCAQAMLSSGSIAAQASVALQRPVDYRETLALAERGVPAARAVFDAAGTALGRLIALSANLTLQSDVVLSGEGTDMWPLIAERATAATAAFRSGAARPVSVHVRTTGFQAWARGAATVAIQTAVDAGDLHGSAGRVARSGRGHEEADTSPHGKDAA